MSDNRKYYYLKLKENYFDDDSIVLLESMQDGVLYRPCFNCLPMPFAKIAAKRLCMFSNSSVATSS